MCFAYLAPAFDDPGVAELLQEALSSENSAANGLTASGLAALFAEAWFPSLTPGYGAAGQLLQRFITCIPAGCRFCQTLL